MNLPLNCNLMFEKILRFYTKYFAAWVILFGCVAYAWPKPFVTLQPYNSWFFALTMFGIGVVLELEDFKRIAQKPLIVLIGTCAQFTIMPLGAFALARLFHLPPEFSLGLVLTGAAPGAMASNVMSYIAKADTAYSVSLTTVSTLLCPVLTPGLTLLLAGSAMKVSFTQMSIELILMVIVPLFAGFAVRHYFNTAVKKVLPVFPAISVTFIIFICSVVIARNRDKLLDATGVILAVVVILNVWGMIAGYGVGRIFRMSRQRKRTLAIEVGMQNAGLGSTLALAHFGPRTALPAAVFVFVCIITASILAEIWQKKTARTRLLTELPINQHLPQSP